MTKTNGIFVEDKYASVGDTLTLQLRGIDGNELSLDVPVVGTYDGSKLTSVYPLVPGNPNFLMTYDTVQKSYWRISTNWNIVCRCNKREI